MENVKHTAYLGDKIHRKFAKILKEKSVTKTIVTVSAIDNKSYFNLAENTSTINKGKQCGLYLLYMTH